MNYLKTRKAALKYFRLCLDMQKAVGYDNMVAIAEDLLASIQEFKDTFVEEGTWGTEVSRGFYDPWSPQVLTLCELPDAKDIFEGLKNGTLTD